VNPVDSGSAKGHYLAARKLGLKEYSKNVSSGLSGYLPNLDDDKKGVEILSEQDLGTFEIPLHKIVGTYTKARSKAFAPNFMPIMGSRTEFAQKWANLCAAHIDEGIRDPVKVYEFLNRFYVIEGNKRVSVLKYFNAYSISAHVIRLIPRKDENSLTISIYYEFLDFYKKTGINLIWFSKKNSFNRLSKMLDEFTPKFQSLSVDKYKYFANSVYLPFRKAYLELGGQKLPITTGDAFLEFAAVYGFPESVSEEKLYARLKAFIKELELISGIKSTDVQTEPEAEGESFINTITTFVMPKKHLRVAFVYAMDASTSSWTFAQEMGRNHVNNVFGDEIITTYVDNVPETPEAYQYLKKLAQEGNDIVFVTSPSFINATLKAAMEFPETKFLNCMENQTYRHVNTYFGRIYEPRFLAGIVAGAVTKSNILGYVGTHPVPDVINGINAFAIGARMVNPYAKIIVEWLNNWDDAEASRNASDKLVQSGADIISHHDTLSKGGANREFGVYLVIREEGSNRYKKDYIAAPIWNWGIFYEHMIRNIMNNRKIFGNDNRVVNFWWGMDSGIVDFFYSKRLVPVETQKLVEFLRNMIIKGEFHPFTGPIYSQDGKLRVKHNEIATREQIINMDWFVSIIDSKLPANKNGK